MAFEVSIIVVTYNCEFGKLEKTLRSALMQKGVSFEIIIADDGSADNHVQEIKDFFAANSFSDYKCVMNPENQGTVVNCLSGFDVAEGEYTKLISPGDYFCSPQVLHSWLDFVRERKAEWSFSEARYYDPDSSPIHAVSAKANPQKVRPYLNRDWRKCRWNYVVLDDNALGAAMLGNTGLQRKYLNILRENGVRFAEDNMFRLMMFDGVCGEYFPEITINYEYGTGISSGDNSSWKKLLLLDWNETNRILEEKKDKDSFQERMIKNIHLRNKGKIGKVFVKGIIDMWIRRHIRPRMTPVSGHLAD